MVTRHNSGWLNKLHDSAPGMALSKLLKQIKITHPQAAVILWKRFCETSHRGVVNRNASFLTSASALCGFATRSRKETGQQKVSYYKKIQLLSDRSRQKRVSTKPVSLSEKPIQTVLPFLHLSNAPIMHRLPPTSDYDLVRATTTRHDTIGKETEYIILVTGNRIPV